MRVLTLKVKRQLYIVLYTVPGQPMVRVDSIATASVSLSWSVPNGTVVESYEVKWSSEQCPEDREENITTISDNSTTHIISQLRSGTSYSVSITANNSAGHNSSGNVTVETKETSLFCMCVEFSVAHDHHGFLELS